MLFMASVEAEAPSESEQFDTGRSVVANKSLIIKRLQDDLDLSQLDMVCMGYNFGFSRFLTC